jgi:GntR family transcriptional regulator
MQRAISRYQWVYNSLKNRIEVEDFKVGDFLPPEPELQRMFNVSRTTVRKAVEMLGQHGFVYIRQGRGTQTLDFKATQKLGYVTAFSETLREQGVTVTQLDVRVDTVPAPRRTAGNLGVAPGSLLVKIDRVTLANGTPIAHMTNWPLPDIAPDIARRIAGMGFLYSFLESSYNLVIEAATDYLSARQATREEAAWLQIPADSPTLVEPVEAAGWAPDVGDALAPITAETDGRGGLVIRGRQNHLLVIGTMIISDGRSFASKQCVNRK